MNRHERVILIVLLVAFGIANFISTTPTALAQEDRWSGYTITGNTYFISGPRPGRTLPFKLIINRLTTPDEVRQLNSALQSGQDDLLRTLSRMNAGRIEVGSGVGVPANAILVTARFQRIIRLDTLNCMLGAESMRACSFRQHVFVCVMATLGK